MSAAQQCSRLGVVVRVAIAILPVLVAAGSLGVARAEDKGLCSTLSGHGAAGGYRVLDTRELTRVQARPWNFIPEGVAFLLDAPAGTTSVDLHRAVAACARDEDGLAAASDQIRVTSHGSHYIVKLTARDRARALQLTHAAK